MRRAALLAALVTTAGLVCGPSGCGSGDDSGVAAPTGDAAVLAPLPKLPSTLDLKAVWGTSSTSVWAVGSGGTIVQYDGTDWNYAELAAPPDGGEIESLTGVDGASNDDVWVTGDQGSVLHWNGKKWSIVSNTPNTVLLQVWVGSSSNVWAVGLDTNLLGGGYVTHWDGTAWQDSDDSSTTSFWQVWGSGPDDVWLVGDSIDGSGVALRGSPTVPFNTSGYAGPALRAVWGSGPDDVWVAAYTGDITHWDGTSWTSTPSAVPTASLLGMHGVAKGDVWAVGNGGIAEHFVDGKWVATDTGTTKPLWALWGDGPSDVWAVGGGGTVLRWNGQAWVR
ncbi:MAG: WD40/YVTN/BNR-like repeat-containing protein [Polyangiaceae bacterium]